MKKGIAIKYTPGKDQDPVYTSVIKEFDSQEDFNNFKDNLNPKKEIIGVIDIKDDLKEQKLIFESKKNIKDDVAPKMITKFVQNEFPFIKKIEFIKEDRYKTLISVNVYFDVNEFRKLNGKPPVEENDKDFYSATSYSGLIRYLEKLYYTQDDYDESVNKWGSDFKKYLEKKINSIYEKLNPELIYTKYDDHIPSDNDPSYIASWVAEKEPRTLSISFFYPIL